MPEGVSVRPAAAADAAALAEIFNQGVEDRVATFQTALATAEDMEELVAADPVFVVAERAGTIVGFGRVSPYADAHPYYAGVGEASVYVAREARGTGAGRALMDALAAAGETAGFYKLTGKIFTSNEPSRR
jgi:phosphinothricin acetyltransferase